MTYESIRPKVESPETLCSKCTHLKANLKATSIMETLLLRLAKSDSRDHQLRPIYDLFENTTSSATTKKDLIDAIRRVAGATTLWNNLWSNRLKKKDINSPITVHTYYSAAVCMLANSLVVRKSNGKEDCPDPTCSKPKITNRQRAEHKTGSGSTRDTLKALLDRSNRAEASIFWRVRTVEWLVASLSLLITTLRVGEKKSNSTSR